jgi:amphi-Trp domain-containing protein
MPEEVLFESESKQSRAAIADYLRNVADSLDGGGDVTLTAGDQSIQMDVPGELTFEVKAERETAAGADTGELSLELELEWDENGASDGDLTIG